MYHSQLRKYSLSSCKLLFKSYALFFCSSGGSSSENTLDLWAKTNELVGTLSTTDEPAPTIVFSPMFAEIIDPVRINTLSPIIRETSYSILESILELNRALAMGFLFPEKSSQN
jgi:hypothetical protein